MYHLRHRLRIFLFCKKIMFCFQDTQVFVFLTIPWFTKSLTSWWILVHKTGCILNISFEPQLTKSPNLANWQILTRAIIFRNCLTIWRLGPFHLATCSNYSITSYDQIPVFHYFEKVNKGHLKMVNVKYEKWPDFTILLF